MGRLEGLLDQRFDLAIAGGGIIGAGIARDAALRGLKVALVEMADFAHGTSSASTRLIHGGLRYLEQYDFGLVRQDLREREILLRIAPHLVHPLPFLIPVYSRSLFYRMKLRAGMVLYDLLSYDRSLPGHRWLSTKDVLAIEPGLNPEGLQGAFLYHDGQVPSVERLCMENLLAAREQGAKVTNYLRVTGYLQEGSRVTGLAVEDQLTGETGRIRARVVVNATGPWLDSSLDMLQKNRPPLVRRTMGIHLATPRGTNNALVLFASDGRLFFVIPWNGLSLVGTTDTDFDTDPDQAAASSEDIRYLLDGVQPVLPQGPWNDIYYTTAGVRALIRVEGVHESSVPRGHMLVEHSQKGGPAGLISVVGGKVTAYRAIARETTDLVCHQLAEARAAATDREPLPGARFANLEDCYRKVSRAATALGLDESQSRYLVDIYGIRALEPLKLAELEPRLAERISPASPDILAQLHHAVQQEMALKVEDFMLRRSMLGFAPSRGREAAEVVAAEMGQLLGWDETRRRDEEAAYLEKVGNEAATQQSLVER